MRPTPMPKRRGGPTPTSRSLTYDVAVEEAPQLGRPTQQRFLRGDHDQVEVGRADAKHGLGIPVRKPEAEGIQDLDQLSFVGVVGIHPYITTSARIVPESMSPCPTIATA
jgi:hypothetical protein